MKYSYSVLTVLLSYFSTVCGMQQNNQHITFDIQSQGKRMQAEKLI